MILLTAITHSLILSTGGVQSVDWSADYVDITTTAFSPDSGQGNVAAIADTTIVGVPAASTQRQVKLITVRNLDSTAVTVTIKKDVSGTQYALSPDVELESGEVLQYLDGRGFCVLDPFGAVKALTEVSNEILATENESLLDAANTTNELLFRILMQLQVDVLPVGLEG